MRVQRRRAKGWLMPKNTIYVGHPTKWGNPFIVGVDGTREYCVFLYRSLACGFVVITSRATKTQMDAARLAMQQAKRELQGKDLACWCPLHAPCHADVLLEIANGRAGK